ncbi:MAG: HD domain-containing protein [Ruminococcus sp.]|nr:HD domain-containing protein [Ruminococcus sp.]
MFKKLAAKYKSIKDNKGGIFPLLGISLIILLLTFAVYVVSDYISQDYKRESAVFGWDYLYTDEAGVTPNTELRVFNSQSPIITENSVKKPNIYFAKTFEPLKTKKTLVLLSDHSPMKIKINGSVVYDNQFDTAIFTGNCYNAVTLNASSREQVVEVYMRLPLSVRFEAYYSDTPTPAFSFSFDFVSGAVLAILGLISSAVFAIISFRRKERFRSLAFSALLTYTGAAVVLMRFSEISYLLNSPFWLNIQTAFVHITVIVGVLCALRWFSNRKKYVLASIVAAVISLICVMAGFVPFLYTISTGVMSVLCCAAAVYAASGAMHYVLRRTMYAASAFVIIVYYSLVSVLSGLFLFFRIGGIYAFTITMPTLVLGGVFEYIFLAEYRYKKANVEISAQIGHYGESVDNISFFIRNILKCSEEMEFFDTAVSQLCELLYKYNNNNSDLRYGVGVKTDNGYDEIINHGLSSCGYDKIEANCVKNDKDCIFSGTYFDYVLKKESGVYAIIHFENITDGLEVFFDSMIETAYCGLETAFRKTCDKEGGRSIDVIFSELAENSEVDNGYSPEHLEHIEKYVCALCKKIGKSDEEARQIGLAAKLHDLGKIAIPNDIINKDARLTEEEQIIVSSHARFGYLILSAYSDDPLLSLAAEIARYHHERYDGSGTNGLKGEEIPLVARVTTICDVYDALVTERSYKQAWSEERAKSFMEENKGVMFDPELTDQFLECLSEIEI